MPRIRVDNVGDQTGSTNPISITTGGAVSWPAAPLNMPAVAAPNTLAVAVNPNTATEQRVVITAYTAGATTAVCSTTLEGGGTLAAITSAPWVHAPTTLDFGEERTLLFDLTTPYKVFHQANWHIVASGTFTPARSTYVLEIDASWWQQGAAFSGITGIVGINGGNPASLLFVPNAQTGAVAAGGVTDFRAKHLFDIGLEHIAGQSTRWVLTGLTPGTVYTYQFISAQAGGAQNISTVGASPFYGRITPDNKTLWVANYGDNSVVPVKLGTRPDFSYTWYQTGPAWAAAGRPIQVGTNPYSCTVSPNNQYVLVCNYGSGTVTVINQITKQVIGTTTVNAAAHCTFAAFTWDSTVCWVSCTDGKVYPLTMSLTAAPTLGTGVLVRNANDQIWEILMHPDGVHLYVANQTANLVYGATLPTTTTLSGWTATAALSGLTAAEFVRTANTFGKVAAGITLTAGTLTSLAVTGVFGAFTPQSGTIQVPISGGYVTMTYQYATFGGGTTTFHNLTGGGGQTTIAGNVVYDLGFWVGGVGSTVVQHVPGIGGTPDLTYTLPTPAGCSGMDVLSDGQEIWVGSSNGRVTAFSPSGQDLLGAVTMPGPCYGINLSTDGYAYTNIVPASGSGYVYCNFGGVGDFLYQSIISGVLKVVGSNA